MTTLENESGPTVSVPFVDVASSVRPLAAGILLDVEALLESGAFINGPQVADFEAEFAASCGRRFCVGLASGLDALRLGLLAGGLEEGDEVIVPAMTFIATFEAVVQAGGTPVVVDVREDDVGMDVEQAASRIGPRTRFLLPVHLYGQMADVGRLVELGERYGLDILEDACQAHGATRDGFRAGAVGRSAAFSFYPSKNLGAMGDAGALVLDDEEAAATVRALREHGQVRRYESDRVGYTARLDTIQAMVLGHKLPLLEAWNTERQRVAAFYDEALDGVGDLRLPATVPGAVHVWHVYAVRTSAPEALGRFLAERRIGTGRHYPQAPHLSPAFASLGHQSGAFPVAEAVARETLSLPVFPGITESQLTAVAEGVREFFESGHRAS
jgi:dTDP-4-amino-4,6-dideoxygalactose transaminase